MQVTVTAGEVSVDRTMSHRAHPARCPRYVFWKGGSDRKLRVARRVSLPRDVGAGSRGSIGSAVMLVNTEEHSLPARVQSL